MWIRSKRIFYYLMLFYFTVGFALFPSQTTYGRSYGKDPLSPANFEKGVLDFDFFRAEMLEKGFDLKKRTRQGNIGKLMLMVKITFVKYAYRCQLGKTRMVRFSQEQSLFK